MARYYQIASVLYDVLKTVTPEKSHSEVLHPAIATYSFNLMTSLHNTKHYNLEHLFCSLINMLKGLKRRKLPFHITTSYPLIFLVPHNL